MKLLSDVLNQWVNERDLHKNRVNYDVVDVYNAHVKESVNPLATTEAYACTNGMLWVCVPNSELAFEVSLRKEQIVTMINSVCQESLVTDMRVSLGVRRIKHV